MFGTNVLSVAASGSSQRGHPQNRVPHPWCSVGSVYDCEKSLRTELDYFCLASHTGKICHTAVDVLSQRNTILLYSLVRLNRMLSSASVIYLLLHSNGYSL